MRALSRDSLGTGPTRFSHTRPTLFRNSQKAPVFVFANVLQSDQSEKYFHPRPSAAGSGYDGTSSSGTNLGPTSQKLINNVQAAVEQYRKENSLSADELIPGDAVTSSGSGLDPHISVRNAELQTPRVAKARGLSQEQVHEFVRQNTDGAQFGILGDPGVNVLKFNLALDQAR